MSATANESYLLNSYALSLVQQDIFYDQLHHLGTPKYNIGGYVLLGSIDENKLKQAHALVVSNNRMFAMMLENQSTGVFVRFSEEVNTEISVIDFTFEVNPELSAKNWMDHAFAQPFDLFGKSLFSVHLLKISNDKYYYVAIAHHLMIDGWAIATWAQQLGDYYSGLTPNIEPEESFLTYFSQDFTYLDSARYLSDQLFWREYLSGQSLRFLSPGYATAKNSECSKRFVFDIDVELYKKLLGSTDIFEKNEHSFFVALIALYFGRVAQRNKIIVGVPAHNRRGAVHKKIIGLYTSVSPLRISLEEDIPFDQLVEMIKVEQAKVYRHQKYPLGHMVRDLGPEARGGLFDVGVNYLKLDNKFAYGDSFAEIRYVENRYQTTPFNVTVWNNGAHQPLQLQIDFCLHYFNDDEVNAIGARLVHLMQQIADNPGVSIADLALATGSELSAIFSGSGRAPEVSQFTPFVNLFEQQVALQPDRVALSYREHSFTYAALNQLSTALAQKLSARGVAVGHIVGLLLGRKPEMVIAILALHKLGAAYLPLDPSYPSSRLKFMLDDSGCQLLLTTEDLAQFFAEISSDVGVMLLDGSTDVRENQDAVQCSEIITRAVATAQLAYVIYTSGSTGNPKGVMLSQESLSNFLQSMASEPGFGADDCLLAVTPFSFDISILELLMPLMSGGTLRLFHTNLAQDIGGLIRDLEQHPITMLQMTPSAWKMLLAADWKGSEKLVALTGGEALPAHVADALVPKVKQLWNMYGPTETTIWSSCSQVHLPRDVNSIGTPIANTQMLILDAKNRVLPAGVFGMLYIGGKGLAHGYWQRPELTDEKFVELFGQRWYQTGDVARLLANGEFEFQGRSDHQVKLNGYRIELGEIEALLSRYPGVTNNAVLIKKLDSGRDVLCAYYQSLVTLEEQKLKEFLGLQVPAYMIPSFFIRLPVFPLTPSGKTDLKALPAPVLENFHADTNTAEQHDEITQTILLLVKKHLQIAHLNPADNFFDVGATSMDVTQMSIVIKHELNVDISVIDLFAHPSVAGLVRFLQGKNTQQQSEQMLKRQESAQRGRSRLNDRLNVRKMLDEA